jgi:hypothetical protein
MGNKLFSDRTLRRKGTYTAAIPLRKSKNYRSSSYIFRCCIRSETETVSSRYTVPSDYYWPKISEVDIYDDHDGNDGID